MPSTLARPPLYPASAAVIGAVENRLSGWPSQKLKDHALALLDALKTRTRSARGVAAAMEVGRALGRAPAPVPEQRVNLGDVLTALGEVQPASAHEPWLFDPQIKPQAVEALGYQEGSAGIARAQRENREGWWAHSRRNRAFILNAAAAVREPRLAVVFGAGNAHDLPLLELCRRFERLVLVDIDARSLAATADAVIQDRALRQRIELRPMDLTGVTARLAADIERIGREAPDAASAVGAFEALCHSYHLASAPQFLPSGERADLLVSGMVLTQLALQPKLLAQRACELRFGAVPAELEERWTAAWDGLELRIQQDHINALPASAALAVLTSDTIYRVTSTDAKGAERLQGESWTLIGADTLEERIPRGIELLKRDAWTWPRVKPRRGFHGARMDVGAAVIAERSE